METTTLSPFLIAANLDQDYCFVGGPAFLVEAGLAAHAKLICAADRGLDDDARGTAKFRRDVDGLRPPAPGLKLVWRTCSGQRHWELGDTEDVLRDRGPRPIRVVEGFFCAASVAVTEAHFEAVHRGLVPVMARFWHAGAGWKPVAVEPVQFSGGETEAVALRDLTEARPEPPARAPLPPRQPQPKPAVTPPSAVAALQPSQTRAAAVRLVENIRVPVWSDLEFVHSLWVDAVEGLAVRDSLGSTYLLPMSGEARHPDLLWKRTGEGASGSGPGGLCIFGELGTTLAFPTTSEMVIVECMRGGVYQRYPHLWAALGATRLVTGLSSPHLVTVHNRSVRIWTANGRVTQAAELTLPAHATCIAAPQWSGFPPTGARFAAGDREGNVHVLRDMNASNWRSMQFFFNPVRYVLLSPSGRYVAAISDAGRVGIASFSGEPGANLPLGSAAVAACFLEICGVSLLAIVTSTHRVSIYSAVSGAEVLTFGCNVEATTICADRAATKLVIAGTGGRVELYRLAPQLFQTGWLESLCRWIGDKVPWSLA